MNEYRKCGVNMEYYLALRKKNILPFGTIWMNLEDINLSKISQKQKDKYHVVSLIHGI